MSVSSGLNAALVRENAKLVRQLEAIEATKAMVALIEGQIAAEAKKAK